MSGPEKTPLVLVTGTFTFALSPHEAIVIPKVLIGYLVCPKKVMDYRFIEFVSPVGVLHDEPARMAEQSMICVERRAEGGATIARRWLNVDLFEWSFSQ